ncbi:hypothetical protein C9I98_13045 [Photobacterium sanctipauli]|uniref:Uncharacterized protein n=1 Tax=Photobacterium sanctipauli TaxID=1342794 RepID=A0A2T3NSP3_9GAMM|nr:hypothetical protein [Photobacterium sanctipauli]PSW19290.1 hypothetical protein C9I98_13045 [Photobacterium sanctipauli]
MRLSRRGWNNVIIIGVICFIAMIQIPELLKQRQLEAQQRTEASSELKLTNLLPERAEIRALHLPGLSLDYTNDGWRATPSSAANAAEVVNRWQALAGTPVDKAMVDKLAEQLTSPRTVEVWLEVQPEPIRVTVYQLPQFWLLKNWQGEWLAISVDEGYLFP